MKRKTVTAPLLAALCALAAACSQNPCVPSKAVATSLALIAQPFQYTDLKPALTQADIAKLPALPDPTAEIPRREHAYISTALAAALGDLHVNPDWRQPNPQIRVRLTSPATLSNWKSGTTFRDRSSNAVFTVVGVIEDNRPIVWIYNGLDGTNVVIDSGQYKLFAEDTVSSGKRVRKIKSFADADNDGLLDTVAASVFCSPVSQSTVTAGGSTTPTNHYAENDASGSYVEAAVRMNDNRFALLVPHGGAIETGTSEQITPFVSTLKNGYNIDANSWKAEGQWGDDQTSKRWHITSTSLAEASFPALTAMLNQPWYNNTHPFRRTLALHGFTPRPRRTSSSAAARTRTPNASWRRRSKPKPTWGRWRCASF